MTDWIPPLPPGGGAPPPPAEPHTSRTGPAWEQPGPSFERFAATTRDVLLEPTACFRHMRREGGLGPPLLFGIVGTLLGGFFASVYQVIFSTLGIGLDGPEGLARNVFGAVATTGCVVVVLPAVAVVSMFIGSALHHLVLWILGSARQPYETTLRVNAYAMGAVALLNVVPICGGIVAAVWGIVATIIGLAESHEISLGRAAAAVLVPVAVCCAVVLLFYAAAIALLLGGLMAGSWQ